MTPAMRRWAEKIGAGYTIRRRWVAYGALPCWRWELVDPAGVYVQTVRRDTVRRLSDLGVLDDHVEVAGQGEVGGGEAVDGAVG